MASTLTCCTRHQGSQQSNVICFDFTKVAKIFHKIVGAMPFYEKKVVGILNDHIRATFTCLKRVSFLEFNLYFSTTEIN